MTDDPLRLSAQEALRKAEIARQNPEPSLGRRFGQIGLLGWMILMPILAGVISGRWLDRLLGSGITVTAALTMLGAVLGLWLAFRWMHRQ
jgi:ATP synthase protein I